MGPERITEIFPGWQVTKRLAPGSCGTMYILAQPADGTVLTAGLKHIPIPQNEGTVAQLYSMGYDESGIRGELDRQLEAVLNAYRHSEACRGHKYALRCDDIRYFRREDSLGWDVYVLTEPVEPVLSTQEQRLTPDQVARLGRDLCAGLELYGEDTAIPEILPQNIYRTNRGVYVLDSICPVLESEKSGIRGGFMAPEACGGQSCGMGSHLYALGMVMYWLLNERRLPFLPLPPQVPTAEQMDTARMRRLSAEPIPAPVNGGSDLHDIVLTACTFDMEYRFRSPVAMGNALSVLAGTEEENPVPVPPAPVITPEPAGAPRKKRKKKGGLAALLVLLVLAAALVVCYFTVHIPGEAVCTQPSVCRICTKTLSEVPGHDYSGSRCTRCGCDALEFLTHPADIYGTGDVAAVFTVEAEGPEISYQWQESADGKDWEDISGKGGTSETLTVSCAGKNGYRYRCVVTDDVGAEITSEEARLYVLEITGQPQGGYMVAGEYITFSVSTTEAGELTYQWQYRTSPEGNWIKAVAEGNDTMTMRVEATAGKDNYEYRCRVTDTAGNKVFTEVVKLQVLGVKSQPVNRSVRAGKDTTFSVAATGEGLSYQWQYRTSPEGNWIKAVADGNQTDTMTVAATAGKNGYEYRCKITDKFGNVIYTEVVKLTVK